MPKRKAVEGNTPTRSGSNRRVNGTVSSSRLEGKLSSILFDKYLEKIWQRFPEEKRAPFALLDCLWFSLYMKKSHKSSVLSWIKKKQIFLKKYVFVPIVHWSHWCLLIFCNFGEGFESEGSTPCMLFLDSLQMAGSRRFEPGIRKFVMDIYQAEERPENKYQISKIPFLVPEVPQQRNAEECGNFVLYFISLFMGSAPEKFSITDGYPYFMTEDWFRHVDYSCFCKELDSYREEVDVSIEVQDSDCIICI